MDKFVKSKENYEIEKAEQMYFPTTTKTRSCEKLQDEWEQTDTDVFLSFLDYELLTITK